MQKTIDIDGVRLAYTVNGSGEQPAVLMHGWGCTHSTLASIEQVLTPKYTVYNVDFPGFGDSSEPQSVWGVDDYTRLIEKFIAAEGITNPVLLGHSFGGRVGILYASRNAVSRLILVDAAGIKPRRSLKYYCKVYSYKAVKHVLTLFGSAGEKMLNAYRGKVGSSDYSNSSPMMRAILSKTVNEDLTDRLPLIKCPTLLIWGEADTATPLRDAKLMEKLIPDAGLVSWPGVGHYSFLERAPHTAAVLRSFLKIS
ncbi:MAG: alpha/beta hydrolase [Muribaculaceae bacterium]|nr:alpha/beta hydrolase [Muribaculaceae bacterium]